jgi:hypothetical protein
LQLKKEADLPSLICNKCNILLPKYLKFHQQCIKSYHDLKNIDFAAIKQEKIEEIEQVSLDTPIADDNDEEPDDVFEKLELKFDPAFHPKHEKVPCEMVVDEKEPPEVKKSKSKKRQCNVCGAIVINLKCKKVFFLIRQETRKLFLFLSSRSYEDSRGR